MKRTMLLLALLCAGSALAQSTYRWVDQEGRVHYGDRPPPAKAAREVQEKRFAVPVAKQPTDHETRQAAAKFPVTLYVSPDCGTPCKQGRDYLTKRKIPFTEQSVGSNEEIIALRERLGGGEIVVPILMVGDKFNRGFQESAWTGMLDVAGYPKAANP